MRTASGFHRISASPATTSSSELSSSAEPGCGGRGVAGRGRKAASMRQIGGHRLPLTGANQLGGELPDRDVGVAPGILAGGNCWWIIGEMLMLHRRQHTTIRAAHVSGQRGTAIEEYRPNRI